jgi:response regulator RpfG family c-di-GMP phosphodiesterase
MSGHPLTSDEIHTARLLRREGKTFGQIARRLGHSRESIRDVCKGLARIVIHDVKAVAIPDHVLAERDQRLARQPRDLTAAIVGDPLPGRSALDRKMANVTAMRSKLVCVRPST